MLRRALVFGTVCAVAASAVRCGTDYGESAVLDAAPPNDGSSDADGSPDGTATCSPKPDFLSDPRHCGRCDRDCGKGLCANGECTAYLIATAVMRPWLLAVDDTHVYWTSSQLQGGSGAMMRVTKDGGPPETLAGPGNSYGIASDGPRIVFSAPESANMPAANAGIYVLAKNTSIFIPIATGTSALDLAVRDQMVYFTSVSPSDEGLNAVQIDGGGRTLLLPSPREAGDRFAEGVASDVDSVYVARDYEQGSIGRVATGRAPEVAYIPNLVLPRRVYADDKAIYWTSASPTPDGGVYRQLKGIGNLPVPLLQHVNVFWGGIALDDRYAWITLSREGRVVRVEKDGSGNGAMVVLAEKIVEPLDIVADKISVYFTDRIGNQVWAMTK